MRDHSRELAEDLDRHNDLMRRATDVTKAQAKRLFGITEDEISKGVRRLEDACHPGKANGNGKDHA